MNKVITAAEAIAHVKDGDRVMIGGFGLRGTPYTLVAELIAAAKKDLTIISNDLDGIGDGLQTMLDNHSIKALVGSYYTWNPEAVMAYNQGLIGVTLVPQGTLAEGMRAAGVGIPAFYTPTSADTTLGEGKEVREFNGRNYVLEMAIPGDVALVYAKKADKLGNLVYSKTAQNFNPAMAMAAKFTIAEVEELVEVGEIKPEEIDTPHLFVNAIVVKRSEK